MRNGRVYVRTRGIPIFKRVYVMKGTVILSGAVLFLWRFIQALAMWRWNILKDSPHSPSLLFSRQFFGILNLTTLFISSNFPQQLLYFSKTLLLLQPCISFTQRTCLSSRLRSKHSDLIIGRQNVFTSFFPPKEMIKNNVNYPFSGHRLYLISLTFNSTSPLPHGSNVNIDDNQKCSTGRNMIISIWNLWSFQIFIDVDLIFLLTFIRMKNNNQLQLHITCCTATGGLDLLIILPRFTDTFWLSSILTLPPWSNGDVVLMLRWY